LHERTTSCLSFALEEVIRNRKRQGLSPLRLLTTDIEYPGVLGELLPELERQDAIELLPPIRMKQLIFSGATKERMQAAMRAACKDCKPDVILISHVYYACGYVLDVELLIKSFEDNTKPIMIVDGAQSLGNIEVAPRLLEQVEYYASGVHKWLLVPRPLGILVRNGDLLRTKHGYETFEMPNRPDSAFPVTNSPFSVTISYDPYFGLGSVLRDEFQVIKMDIIAKHNRRLADMFRNEMMSFGYRSIGDESHSAIVSVAFGAATEALHRSLQVQGIKCKFLRLESEADPILIIRFCFHFYHGKDDLFRLLDKIEAELVRAKT